VDGVGLVDAVVVERTSAGARLVASPVGIHDSVTLVRDRSTVVSDGVGIADSAAGVEPPAVPFLVGNLRGHPFTVEEMLMDLDLAAQEPLLIDVSGYEGGDMKVKLAGIWVAVTPTNGVVEIPVRGPLAPTTSAVLLAQGRHEVYAALETTDYRPVRLAGVVRVGL
jgi:hypothetical protein